MSLFDEIAEAEDLDTIDLTVPTLKTKAHPEGLTIRFKGLPFMEMANLSGMLDLDALKEKKDLSQMLKLIGLTAYDPANGEKVFDTDDKVDYLKKKGFATILFMLTKGVFVVLGLDEDETAGKDSSSTPTAIPVSDEFSSESPETPAEPSRNFSEEAPEDFDL